MASPYITADPWIEHAREVIEANDNVKVTLEAKNKDLLKFGRNKLVGTSSATIMKLPAGELHETYVSDNIITSIISDSASDTEIVTVEGHTISGSDLTFVTQNVTLTGTTVVTLATPLARATRVFNDNSTDLVGNIYVTEDDTYSVGVPDTATGVHIIVDAGQNQSGKASTSLSSVDYWVITGFYGDLFKKAVAFANIDIELRFSGMVFRQMASIAANRAHEFKPYLIAPPNSDIRLVATADGVNTDISGGIQGVLLKA